MKKKKELSYKVMNLMEDREYGWRLKERVNWPRDKKKGSRNFVRSIQSVSRSLDSALIPFEW